MDFVLQPWEMSMAPSLAQFANNKNIAANLRDAYPSPYSREDADSFIIACMEASPQAQYLRAIVVDGEACGSIGVFFSTDVYRKAAELGYWLAEPYWGHGIMHRAVKQLCGEVFERYPDIVRIFAEPYATNTGSRRVLEKAGFTLEGILRSHVYKNGVLQDGCVYGLLRQEY